VVEWTQAWERPVYDVRVKDVTWPDGKHVSWPDGKGVTDTGNRARERERRGERERNRVPQTVFEF
jgi:hypothetical protein